MNFIFIQFYILSTLIFPRFSIIEILDFRFSEVLLLWLFKGVTFRYSLKFLWSYLFYILNF
ncbi:hypothetical protein HMPREF3189_01390 [Clostridiales bacterium KA00134]|nr:hypothetical protein HMPREF3189_01390 [Clostridiales bacterium KA00134]